MNLTDKCFGRGALRLRVLDAKDRRILRVVNIPNQVCVGALDAFQRLAAQLTAPDDAEECMFYSIWCGTDGTTPTSADLALGADEFREVFDPASLVIDVGGITGLMQMQMTMEAGEGNGFTYVEAGLFTQGPSATALAAQTPGIGAGNARMVARQVHAQVQKTAAIVIEYTWRFQILTV